MMEQKIILNRLLDKYENSKHRSAPGVSRRRVMLKVERKELPEYRYEEAAMRDAYNEAAIQLEQQQLVELTWVKGRPLLAAIVLRLDQIMPCYAAAGRVHPKVRADQVIRRIEHELNEINVPWIVAWKAEVCRQAKEHQKVPAFCKNADTQLNDLLCALLAYSPLSGGITMRAFSIRCFSDTKYFLCFGSILFYHQLPIYFVRNVNIPA